MPNCNQPDYDYYKKNPLIPPNNSKKVLLHTCCAPCCGEVIQAMKASNIELTLFFYNPNIHPKKEYELRKKEDKAFASSEWEQLYFIYKRSAYFEKSYNRLPVYFQ